MLKCGIRVTQKANFNFMHFLKNYYYLHFDVISIMTPQQNCFTRT